MPHTPIASMRETRPAAAAMGRLWLLALALLLALLTGAAPARAQNPLGAAGSADLGAEGALYQAGAETFPAAASGLPGWLSTLRPAQKIDLYGGQYWLYVRLRNDGARQDWVLDAYDTLIDALEARVYDDDGAAVATLLSGYRQPHDYLLHYGKDVTLRPGATYHVLLRFSSPYFARTPRFALQPRAAYRQTVARENVLIIGSLGALLALSIFNFFIFCITREKASLYYALYALCMGVAWSLTFHLGADLFGWHQLQLHYLPFFLLPVFSTLFYLEFLQLRHYAPALARLSRINLVLPLLLLPSCFVALRFAHVLATLTISVWIALALLSGIVAWRRGYQPARFYVLAFVALLLPSLIILPANLGLIPSLVGNAQLLTLLGGALDGLLLAFAMADQIRLLRQSLEQRVHERTAALTESNQALTLANQQADQVSRHRIDFLSAMSHDIRTPLAGVIGMLQFALRDQSVRGRTEEYLRIGLHNSQALLTILNDILDYSKIDAGKLTLEMVDFDLLALIGDALGIVQSQADAKSLLLRSDLTLGLPRYVRSDPTRLRQILINLLGNAIKFTGRGEVRLEAKAGAAGGIEFSVSDTGPGIDAATLPRLFQKFEQADHSTTRRYGGTGLGLAICKDLVDMMGGAITVESTPGIGSTFRFSLPLAAGVAPPPAPPPVAPDARHAYRLRILCAEDARTNQIIIGTLLEGMGHQVHIVENGVQALHALAAEPYDVMLMDGRMPLMDGEQTTRLIRAGGDGQHPIPDPRIPIIALTANASELDRTRYLAAGMNGFLSKPVDERMLFEQIEDAIDLLLSRGRTLRPAAPSEDELARQFGVAAPAPVTAAPPRTGDSIHILPLAGLSAQHMRRIARAFLEEAPRRLALARGALQAGDAAGAGAAFHALKGSAGYLSEPRLHALCRHMETLAASGALDEMRRALPDIGAALDEACAALRAAQ